MTKPPKPTKTPIVRTFPSRDEVLAFIARETEALTAAGQTAPAKIGKREIARAFGIKGADRITLKALLKDMEAQGAVSRRQKALRKPGVLGPVVLADIQGRTPDGEFLAFPVDWDEAQDGARPKILVHTPRKARSSPAKSAVPMAGVGDRVLLRIEGDGTDDAPFLGRVVKLLAKAGTRMLGIFRAGPGAGGRIVPIDKKSMGREFIVGADFRGDAEDGDLVAADTMRNGRFGLTEARVKERLGSMASEKAVSLIALHAHAIPHVFKPATLAEAGLARQVGMAGYEDWRALPLVTVDPADAKDHDDAVHAEPDTDTDNPGGHILTVAIADVAAYVRPGSALDREALERGNSVYFPDRVVPMLPERISNDLCSLKPHVDRPALAVRMAIGADGRKRSHSFHRVMMRSAAKLAYGQAQAAIDGRPDDVTGPLLDPVLRPLWAAYASLKLARAARNPLDLDLPERKIILTADGGVDRIAVAERLDAHRLIEECMILANVAAAETLDEKRQPLLFRVHDEPSLTKMNALAEFLSTIGIKLAKGQVLRPAQFNGILSRAKNTENEALVNEVILRAQAQAEYAADNYGHFGLNLRRYAHFTSPIRRYADLIVHRALIKALKLGKDGLPDMPPAELKEIATLISAAERRAMGAERETSDRLIAGWLADRIGATFRGRIAGVTRAGLFVKLAETGADGFIPIGAIGDDYYRFDEGAHTVVGTRTGDTHRLGDVVEVKLVEAAPLAGALRFELAAGSATAKSMRKGRGKAAFSSPRAPAYESRGKRTRQ